MGLVGLTEETGRVGFEGGVVEDEAVGVGVGLVRTLVSLEVEVSGRLVAEGGVVVAGGLSVRVTEGEPSGPFFSPSVFCMRSSCVLVILGEGAEGTGRRRGDTFEAGDLIGFSWEGAFEVPSWGGSWCC